MQVTTYQDLLNNDHDALMAECEARYSVWAQLKPARQRRAAAMLAEYEATLAATSINMINFNSTPGSR